MANTIDELINNIVGAIEGTTKDELTPEQRELAESIEAEEAEKREKQARQAERLQALYLPADDPELLELAADFVDATTTYREPDYLLTYEDVKFCPLGNVQLIAAPKKSGKTFFVSILMAAILSDEGGYMGITCNIPDATVLYIDTEMHISHTAKVMARVQYLSKWPMNENNPRFHVLNLRTDNANTRRKKVETAIKKLQPQAVFIDGARDLLGDFNDIQESAELIGDFMAWSAQFNCAIWNVQHLPKSDKEAVSPRGHLGTETENKMSDGFILLKNGKGIEAHYTAEHTARDMETPKIVFRITTEYPEGQRIAVPVPYQATAGTSPQSPTPPPVPKSERDKLQELLEGVFGSVSTLGTATISQRLQEATKKGKSHADHLKGKAKELGLITPVEGQAYTYQLASRSTDEQLTLLDNGTEHEHTEATQSTPQASAMSEGTSAPDGLPFTPPDGESAPF